MDCSITKLCENDFKNKQRVSSAALQKNASMQPAYYQVHVIIVFLLLLEVHV